jgi:hypothetical protein
MKEIKEIEEVIYELVEQINSNLQEVRKLKEENNLTLGYSLGYGGILNAYREGDLSFKEAIEQFKRIK